MEVQRDFKELLALLNEHKVEYLIGGIYTLRPGTEASCLRIAGAGQLNTVDAAGADQI